MNVIPMGTYSIIFYFFLGKYQHPPFPFDTCIQALAAALCMNIYVVGLNQLFDIEIDKVFLC